MSEIIQKMYASGGGTPPRVIRIKNADLPNGYLAYAQAYEDVVVIDETGNALMAEATANKQANSPASCLSNSKNKTVFSLNRSTIRAATNDSVSADLAVTAITLDINQLIIGKYDSMANMHIRSLKYFPKALAATELQAMTS